MALAATVAELLDATGVPGAVVGVVESDGPATILAVGARGDGLGQVVEDAVFAAASLTKPVFATAVMSLVDDGVLELDRPLSEYGAEPWLTDDPRAEAITARMALSHTTGMPNWRGDGELYLRWSPGKRWGYSGEGYAYLWHVVARLLAVSIDRFMADAVFSPLGMSDSSFEWRDGFAPRLAVGHDRRGGALPRSKWPEYKAPAGSLYTTAGDYARFLAHSLANSRRMFEPQARIDDELAWGLGWGIEEGDDRAVWQWGNDPGYKNFVIGVPTDRRGIVVFTNGDRGAEVYREIVRQLLPGSHPSLDAEQRPSWLESFAPTTVRR
jgi:CubicO group peptidase (beta-lactamase class C family)